MARATGLEITETSVRVVEVEGTEKKYRILGAADFPIEPSEDGQFTPEAIQVAVRSAFKAAKARKELVVFGLPARKAVIREIVIPFTDPEQIRKVIKFESESHLPTGNIDEVIVGYHKISESGPRSRLLIIAVPKATLREYLAILNRVGIDPTQVDLDAAALFSLTRLLPDFEGDEEDSEAKVILDVGDVSTTVIVATGAHLRMVRCMRIGSESLTRTLSHDLGIDRLQARTVTQQMLGTELPFATAGDMESREPSTAMTAVELRQDIIRDKQTEFARRIVNEVRRSLSSVQLEAKLKGIWLTGPARTAPGLERELAEAFRVRVQMLDTFHGAEHRLPPQASAYVGVPLGLALKALEHDPLRLEFRQEEFRFAHRFERVRNPLLFAASLLLVILAFLTILVINEFKVIDEKQRRLALYGTEYFGSHFIDPAKDAERARIMGLENAEQAQTLMKTVERAPIENQISRMITTLQDGPIEHLQKNYGVLFGDDEESLPPEQQAKSALFRLDQFLSVFNKLQPTLGVYYIDGMNVSSEQITWTMRASHEDTFTLLKEEFLKLPGCTSATEGSISTDRDLRKYENCKVEFEREN